MLLHCCRHFFLPHKSNSGPFCFQPRAHRVCRAKTHIKVRKKGSPAKLFYAPVETVYVHVFYATVEIHLKCGSAQWVSPAHVATLQILVNDVLVNGYPDHIWRLHHFSRR